MAYRPGARASGVLGLERLFRIRHGFVPAPVRRQLPQLRNDRRHRGDNPVDFLLRVVARQRKADRAVRGRVGNAHGTHDVRGFE